ncbi:hypothetical protein BY996DRAFT_7257194 [Phakopsora pachyrhizi]|uniref:Expressed protein n=1 Tax=Phakopsora pachyrhizi TaxID=170000 RepID=A0AAV0BJM8_PHAPC|nr:hypothetical protein BY996DRAFT_7257194 [Phakopsora pachyrhizi]CAH7686182.1 expressed protein [Phakopsora pachyrhizi]
MWIFEGKFYGLGETPSRSHEAPKRQRCLRPGNVYSVGRDKKNDFFLSNQLKFISRSNNPIELETGHWKTSQFHTENSSPYRLTLKNNGCPVIHMSVSNESIDLRKGGFFDIVHDCNLIRYDPDGNGFCWARLYWKPINICFSPLGPSQRKKTDTFKELGLRFTEARFPPDNTTHFLPMPLRPNLPTAYSLMKNIHIVCNSWLDSLIEMAKVKPANRLSQKSIESVNNRVSQRDIGSSNRLSRRPRSTTGGDETTEDLEARLGHQLSFSELEVDYTTSWSKLENPALEIKARGLREETLKFYQDPSKWWTNPTRSHIFSLFCIILIAPEDNEDLPFLMEGIRLGKGDVFHIKPGADNSEIKLILKEVHDLELKKESPLSFVLIKTHDVDSSSAIDSVLNEKLNSSVKTIDDLIYSIFKADSSSLTDQPSRDSIPSTSQSSKNHAQPLASPPSDKAQDENEIHSMVPSNFSKVLRDGSTANEDRELPLAVASSAPRRNLVRRADTRPYGTRMKGLDLLEDFDGSSQVDELERIRACAEAHGSEVFSTNPQAETVDLGSKLAEHSQPPEGTESAGSGSKDGPSLLETVQATPVRRLLKRKAHNQEVFNINKYMPLLGEEGDLDASTLACDRRPEDNLSSQSFYKRPRMGIETSSQLDAFPSHITRVEDHEVEQIEGPATRMIRIESSLKRKEPADFERGGDEDLAEDSQERFHKKPRNEQPTASIKRRDNIIVKEGTKATKSPRKPSASNSAKYHDKDDELSQDQYLTVKTTGKRLTAQELETNLEFNRLRISKPLVLLKNTQVPTQRMGWDEEDIQEKEIEEMDGWSREDRKNLNAESFFQVKYVKMLRKTQTGNLESLNDIGSSPNFKKFRPKNLASCNERASEVPRKSIKMETFRLNFGGSEELTASREKLKGKVTSNNKRKNLNSEDDELEEESGVVEFRKSTGRNTRLNSQKNHCGGTSRDPENSEDDSDNVNQSPKETDRTFRTTSRSSKSSKNKTVIDEFSGTMTKSSQVRRTSQVSRRKPGLSRKGIETPSESESEGDELAFKGFSTRRR